jgi:SH3-like domain-containing protein
MRCSTASGSFRVTTTFGLRTDMIGQTSTGKTAAIKAKHALRGLALVGLLGVAGSVSAADKDRPTPSGYPVPRYLSIKVDPANARSGPSEDHRLLWIYHAKGLPVQVVAENETWRRICDPEGGLAWVHMRVTDGRRTVMQTQPQPVPLRAAPKPSAPIRAYMASRSIGQLDRCKDGWCRIKVGKAEGWAPEGALWGADPRPQCGQGLRR